jgi:HSP20 family protein
MLYLTRNRAPSGARTPFETGLGRLFDEMTGNLGCATPSAPAASEFAPTIDVTESPGEWRVRAEIPGVAPEDVEVSVTGNVLTIRGEKKSEPVAEGENCRRSERRHGKFVRALEFPADVDSRKVDARVKNGILSVTLPKAEEARPKTVTVRVE